jgi:hypothetical protein
MPGKVGKNFVVNEDREVREAIDLREIVVENGVHVVELPVSEGELRRLRTELFENALPGDRFLVGSTSTADFSWEFMNRLIVTEPALNNSPVRPETIEKGARLNNAESAFLPLPSLLGDASRLEDAHRHAQGAVILVRKNMTAIADVEALAVLLRASGFTIRGVVIVHSEQARWRKWRRFARAYGVGSDPERPWPTIDVLEEEKIRTARPRKRRRRP